MRLLKIVLIIFLTVAIGLGVVLFLLIKSFDINKYKDKIALGLSQNLNQPVTLGQIGLGLSWDKGMTLKVNQLSVGAETSDAPGFFLRAGGILLGVDLKAFFTSQEILITDIELNEPYVNFIKQTEGSPASPEVAQGAPLLIEKPEALTSDSEIKIEGKEYKFRIQKVKIKNGTVNYIDRDLSPEISIPIKGITVSIDDFTLAKPFETNLDCILWSDKANVHYQGQARLDIVKRQIILEKGKLNSDLRLINLNEVVASLPQAQSWGLISPLEGKIDITLQQVVLSPTGLETLSLSGNLNNGVVRQTYLKSPLSNIAVDFSMDERDLTISDINGELARGTIKGQARIDDYLKQLLYDIDVNMADIELKELIPDFHPEIKLRGKLLGQIKAKTRGRSPEDIMGNLDGRANLSLKEGALLEINILRLVLSKISMIPNLVERIYENLSPKYKELLKDRDTYLGSVNADLGLKNNGIIIEDITIDSDTFVLSSQGALDWDNNLSLSGEVRIPAELSKSMTAGVSELQYLADSRGILIPLKSYSGPLTSLRIMPDLEYVGKKLLVSKGKEELNKLLDKVFDSEEDAVNPNDQPSIDQPESAPKQSPERQLIEGVLDAIFK